MTTAPGATSAATSAPQRTTAPSPTDTPLRMVAFPWTHAVRPMRIGVDFHPIPDVDPGI